MCMSLATQKSVAPAGERIALAAIAAASMHPVARVIASDHATDLALSLTARRLGVIRCVERATPEDHTALATMLTEDDFVWAGLVYGEREGSETVGLIETFHVSELDRLVSRLLELREALGEAG
jgi:hypothetical protein